MRVRSDGAAIEVEEYQVRVAGVAAPISGPDGEIVGAIGVSVSYTDFTVRRWELESLVRDAAAQAGATRLR
jgi:acetyl-CoA synthetase